MSRGVAVQYAYIYTRTYNNYSYLEYNRRPVACARARPAIVKSRVYTDNNNNMRIIYAYTTV